MPLPLRLSRHILTSLPPSLPPPSYSRSQLSPGILHFGLGNFHRAHQALYLHHLFSLNKSLDWAIIGAGVLPSELPFHKKFHEQHLYYTLISQSATKSTARVIGSILDYIKPTDSHSILSSLTDPSIRITTLTVTEGGYFVDARGNFDLTHPQILADATSSPPRTVFGLLACALKIRREKDIPPFTVLSCDNVPHNGVVARDAVVGLARLSDPAHADWIHQNVNFPNTMVDGITPETDDRRRKIVENDYGVLDHMPVFSEEWVQWVMEDKFSMGRPEWEAVGVEFVDDVSGYEAMKIRVLNGGHAVIAYPAGLLDIEYAHEAMQHTLIRAFLEKVQREEILPEVTPVPGASVESYYDKVCERFANPKMEDTVRRLCLDGSNRQPKFIMLSIRDRIKGGKGVTGLALESALWCRYCYGESESGKVIENNDPNWEELLEISKRAKSEPKEWLNQENVYGDVKESNEFVREFENWLRIIWNEGTVAAMKKYLKG